MDVKVYEPCPYCQGQGSTVQPSPIQWQAPNVIHGPRIVCNACGGTGKGKVKEIRDEPAR